MKKIFDWIMYSSENPEKISKTIKGLSVFVPTTIVLLQLMNVNATPDSLIGFLDAFGVAAAGLLSLVAAVHTLWGASRKVWKTLAGTNAVLNK